MREAKRPTLIVADAYEDTRSLLRFWLESEGYGVLEAGDGQVAFELTCDLILMSGRMPALGGVEASRLIRQRGKGCAFPIVVMSSYPTKEARAAALALAAGCDSFIPQPVDFDLLSDLLGRLLPGAAGRQPQDGS